MTWRGRYGWIFNGAARRWQQDDIILKLLFCLRPKITYCVISWSYILVGWFQDVFFCLFCSSIIVRWSGIKRKRTCFASLQVLTSIKWCFLSIHSGPLTIKNTNTRGKSAASPGVHPKWGALNTKKTYTMKYTIHVWHLYPLPECHRGMAW